ncbi:tetratricopeptide repeat protein [Brevibacillus ruminantium]|uniref:Tetratricopeptide repeat protein n=1 Tax=Brevibacillus ruminantium TaxID=2950604 RepID=A0ABY4WCW2_9BACL|nr:tetratricopeptide repeat protein [Brevibacillus ruminantium]USG65016.1 tetratricopeptide repeat protein [Brevibacillus ruminantium]
MLKRLFVILYLLFYFVLYLLFLLIHYLSFGLIKKLRPPFLETKPDTIDHELLDRLWEKGEAEEAFSILDDQLKKDPRDYHALNKKAMYLIYQGKNEEALLLLDQALGIQPAFDSALNNKSWALHNLERYEESLTYIEAAIQNSGGTSSVEYVNKGNALKGLQRYEEAEAAYLQATELGGCRVAWYRLGKLYEEIDRGEQAAAAFVSYVDEDPDDPDAYHFLADCYENLGDHEKLLDVYTRWTAVTPDDVMIPYKKGKLLMEKNRWEEAREHYQTALEQFPEDGDLLYGMGKTLCSLNQPEAAVDYLLQAIKWDRSLIENITDDPVCEAAVENDRFQTSIRERARKLQERYDQLARSFPLGEFESNSGTLLVSDPCYERDIWCQGVVENAARGKWTAVVEKLDMGDWGDRCSALMVYHESLLEFGHITWEPCSFVIGVDSGQAGVFDESVYRNDESVIGPTEFMPEDKWYSSCCDQTLGELGAGLINGGAVSSSGLGDGAYEAFVCQNQDGVIVAVKIVFLTAEDLYDWEEEEETEEENDPDYSEDPEDSGEREGLDEQEGKTNKESAKARNNE